ncbi:MAG: glycosyltransferase [Methanoculleus sp.]|uniref:glycosyltransferase n=1 Tax=unclassified Methanoculleus TaxID=2619537 RepID=UPI0025F27907|nr:MULTISPECIES: glycosyltransferase [unclassified Methanoculleus]MCK9297356.1 glycosyltransferase [Methanoculleus sp.]MDD2253380.1 glycosyltransferase [Methanoculleus sp.]MDD3216368.1 glycosyltransferase [Methanoculleus sp.]MDD4314352.1 glycosyltransferase [Methanoculleus sp.]MDD4470710.1 glycosyltransferase [Methanoculleus sp.]
MKILQVTPFFKPLWESGGVARVAYDISHTLHESGHDVTVYTTNRSIYPSDLPTNRRVDVDGMNVYYFENLRKYCPMEAAPVLPYYMPAVARREMNQFDLVHIHDHRTMLTVIASHYARKCGVPYVLQAHGALPQDTGSRRMKRLFDQLWSKEVILGASGVIALNETEAECYRALGVAEEKIAIFPNGIDPAEHSDLPARGRFRAAWGIDGAARVVLYLGRLDPTKGIDLLIRSFAEVAREFDDAVLMLVGGDMGHNDEFRQRVRSLNLDDRVVFTGFVSKEDKMAAYTDADVFVTPSFTGFPMTFLEACLCGTPIVTTGQGDLLEWVDNTVGFTTEYTPEAFAGAIGRLLDDDVLRARFGEQAKELVRTRYNWQAIVRDIEGFYADVANKGRDRSLPAGAGSGLPGQNL